MALPHGGIKMARFGEERLHLRNLLTMTGNISSRRTIRLGLVRMERFMLQQQETKYWILAPAASFLSVEDAKH